MLELAPLPSDNYAPLSSDGEPTPPHLIPHITYHHTFTTPIAVSNDNTSSNINTHADVREEDQNPTVDLEANMQGASAIRDCVAEGQTSENADFSRYTVIPEKFPHETTEHPVP